MRRHTHSTRSPEFHKISLRYYNWLASAVVLCWRWDESIIFCGLNYHSHFLQRVFVKIIQLFCILIHPPILAFALVVFLLHQNIPWKRFSRCKQQRFHEISYLTFDKVWPCCSLETGSLSGERLSDDQIEVLLQKMVELFSFLTDKDLFAEIYRFARSACLYSLAAMHWKPIDILSSHFHNQKVLYFFIVWEIFTLS